MAGEYLDPTNWPLFMQSADMGPPGPRSWPQDLYTSRLRKVQQEHLPPWQQEDMDTAVGMGMSMMPGSLVTRAVTAAPRLATGLLGAGFGAGVGANLLGSAPANAAEDPETVKQLQAQLREAGLYRGAVDGRMGPETMRAMQAKQQADQVRQQQELERQRIEADQARATADQAAAAAQSQAALLNAQQAERKSQEREQGNERLRTMESGLPWYRQALRDYGTPVGMGLGVLTGAATRGGISGLSNRISRTAAEEADMLMATKASGMPARVSRVNEFFRRGGGEVPFTSTPNTAPGFAANPGASPMERLYQPSRAANAMTDAGATAAFGTESAVGQLYLTPKAQAELQAATEAAAADPSEVNIRRLQAAKDNMAIANAVTNFGRAGAIGYWGSAPKFQRNPSQPNFAPAEAERLKIEEWLRKKAPSPDIMMAPPVGIPPAMAGPAAWRQRQIPYMGP